MRVNRILSKCKRGSAVALLTGAMAFQFGGCIPNELTAIETTTVTLDGRSVITSLVNSALIAPLQALIADTINGYFDSLTNAG